MSGKRRKEKVFSFREKNLKATYLMRLVQQLLLVGRVLELELDAVEGEPARGAGRAAQARRQGRGQKRRRRRSRQHRRDQCLADDAPRLPLLLFLFSSVVLLRRAEPDGPARLVGVERLERGDGVGNVLSGHLLALLCFLTRQHAARRLLGEAHHLGLRFRIGERGLGVGPGPAADVTGGVGVVGERAR